MGDQFNIQDIFKKSFLELDMFAQASMLSVLVGLSVTLIIGLFIYQVYKSTFKGVIYSQSFNVSIVALSLVTALIIMTISSNVVLSLGMVGALSIVRFRAAIKDPRDIVFMFWAIAAGIASGAGIYTVAVAGSLFIGLVLIVMSKRKHSVSAYLLVVKYEKQAKEAVLKVLAGQDYELKSKVVSRGITEMTLELTAIGDNTAYVESIADIDGVESAVLVKYNGDFAE